VRQRLPWILRPLVPFIGAWVRHQVASAASRARPLSDFGHAALADYFSRETLERARVVVAEVLPTPPFPTLGIERLRSFAAGQPSAITLLGTFFVRPECTGDAGLFFHELVHVVQWAHLGERAFIETYGAGLLAGGYAGCPLERQAFEHAARFERGAAPYPVEGILGAELDAPTSPRRLWRIR
jgi:hypothetical protein